VIRRSRVPVFLNQEYPIKTLFYQRSNSRWLSIMCTYNITSDPIPT
jgi:hypothetical protein